MKAYIGTKIVLAEPLSFNQFQEAEGFETRADTDMEGYMVVYGDGYRSWSPKEVFEHAYRLVTENESTHTAENLPSHLHIFDSLEQKESLV